MMRMARIITVFVLLAVSLPAKADLSDGLVAHWEFDEGSGSTAYDSTGNNDGTLYGDTSWVAGKVGSYALNFDGNLDYVVVPDSDSISVGTGDYTIAAWINPVSVAGYPSIAAKVKDGDDKEYTFGLNDGKITMGTEKNASNQGAGTTTTPVTTNSWQHITVTFSASTTTPTFYYNGQVQPSSSNITMLPDRLDDDLFIGMVGGTYYNNEFTGKIDDVRIYDRALPAEEVEQLYWGDPVQSAINEIGEAMIEKLDAMDTIDAALEKEQAAYETLEQILESGDYGDLKKGDIVKAKQKVHSATQHQDQAIHQIDRSIEKLKDALKALGWEPPVPVSYWKFDEGSGSTAQDSAGSNHGTINGATWTSGKVGSYALDFDGDGDYVDIPYASGLDIDASDGITVSAWIKLRSYPSGGLDHRPIFGLYYGTDTKNFLTITRASSGSIISWDQWPPGGGFLTSIKPDLNVWYHVVAVQDATYRAIYINGTLDSSDNNPETYTGNTPDIIRIGNRVDVVDYYFDGSIDDVCIYDRALSDFEMELLHYNALD